jgi:hypothetical protein
MSEITVRDMLREALVQLEDIDDAVTVTRVLIAKALGDMPEDPVEEPEAVTFCDAKELDALKPKEDE